ncbi:MAG: APC family permease [Tissierellia bacterium]|nr:APC family permease [Tissierellia bacterium]
MRFKRVEKKKKIKRTQAGSLRKIDFFMLGFGSMIGVGWAVSSNGWLSQAGGPIPAFIGFLIGTLLLVPIGLSYGELMSILPVSGGVMSFTYAAFGSFMSFLSSWFVSLAYLIILPWEAIYINEILASIFPFIKSGPILYEFAGKAIYLNSVLLGGIFALLLLIINIKGSKSAARLQSILSWTIISIGFLVIILSFIKGDLSNLKPIYENVGEGSHKNFYSGVISMIVLVPFFMSGFDTIAQSAGDAKKELAFRDIARMIVLSILAAGAFYAIIIVSTSSVEPWKDYTFRQAPAIGGLLSGVYPFVLGKIIKYLVMIGTLAGLFTTWNGMFMASARLIQSMGKAGLLPRYLAKEHDKFKTPIRASIFCFLAAALGPFVGINFINPLTKIGSVSFVIGWLFTCLSAIKLRIDARCLVRGFRIPGGKYTLIGASVIASIILILTFIPQSPAFMGFTGIILFFSWLLIGLIFYYFTNHGDRGMDEEDRSMLILGTKSNDFCEDYVYVPVKK